MKNLSGKVAAVTGAGSGIGRALAINLAQNGCNVALSDVNEAGLAETAEMLKQYPIKITTQKLDVSDKDAFYAWADQVVADHGKANLVFNNAGVALAGTVGDLSIEDYKWIMDINFYGVVHGTQAYLPLLSRAPRSHLVNLSSLFGLIGVPTQSAYNAAKFAVRGYSEALRQELALAGSPVEVCCVHPGGVDTHIARNARSADPADTPEARAEAFRAFARTAPDAAAAQILRAAERGRARLLLGRDARIAALIATLFPVRYPRLLGLHRAGGR